MFKKRVEATICFLLLDSRHIQINLDTTRFWDVLKGKWWSILCGSSVGERRWGNYKETGQTNTHQPRNAPFKVRVADFAEIGRK